MDMTEKINLDQKFGLFSEHWRPKTVAALNGQEIKVIKVRGEFPWHAHETEDEFFWSGKASSRSNFAIMSFRWAPANAWSCPMGSSTVPAPTRKRKFSASSRKACGTPAT
jgi:hypothetical protein